MVKKNLPEGDRIYDLYTEVYKPHIIRVALELDVFSPLDSGPADAETVARVCGCNQVGIHYLLEYLTSLKVLTKQGEEYSLSQEAATFLVRGKKAYAGDLVMDSISPELWNCLRESLRSGKSRSIVPYIHHAQDAWIESYRNVRLANSLDMWSKVGIDPETTPALRLLDLACGCAIKSLALVQKAPFMELTCLDHPLVLEAAKDLAERMGTTNRVKFVPGDLLSIKLGKEKYDVGLLGQITHYLTKEQNGDLFKRICKALVPGGRLVLDVPMGTKRLDENSSFLSLVLWANSGGRAYSYEEYREMLLAAGFIDIHQLSEHLLSAAR